jgi:hypothetical protein
MSGLRVSYPLTCITGKVATTAGRSSLTKHIPFYQPKAPKDSNLLHQSKKVAMGPQIDHRYLKQTLLRPPDCTTRTRGKTGKKTGPMRYRHAKIDIKLKDNFMNIIAYRARQKNSWNMALHKRRQAL